MKQWYDGYSFRHLKSVYSPNSVIEACTDDKGRDNHIILMHIELSSHVHFNQADEVYLRVGDKSKKLGFHDRLQFTYDKGERFFEDKPVPEAEIDDLDIDFVEEYIRKIGYQENAISYKL